METKLKHLEFIQNVMNRLSTSSFFLKGWTVVLVASLFVLSQQNTNGGFLYLALLPTLVFWGLDGFFLWKEKAYRTLYDNVRSKEPEEIDFDMDATGEGDDLAGWLDAVFSKTLLPFHGVMVTSIVVVWWLQKGA